MAENRDSSAGRLFTWIASCNGRVVHRWLLVVLSCWAEFKSATVFKIASALGSTGTFLALIWLICGHFRQAAQFRAQIKSAYQGSLQPIIVFRNRGGATGGWKMLAREPR